MKKHNVRRKAAPVQEWRISYYPLEEEEFVFTFRSDGGGECEDKKYDRKIEFNWDSGTFLTQLPDSADDMEDALGQMAEELFREQINPQLAEDEILSLEDMQDTPVYFSCGSHEELVKLSALILYSFPAIWDGDDSDARELIFGTQGENAGEEAMLNQNADVLDLGTKLSTEDRQRVIELLEFAINQNTPVGESIEYNDGDANRKNGYSWCTEHIQVNVGRPSFHEMAESSSVLRERLKGFLSSQDLERLLPSR